MSATDTAIRDTISSIVPTWLQDPSVPDPDPRFPTSKVQREMRTHNLTCLLERILDGMCEGNSASATIRLDHNGFTIGEVMRWILTNPERKKRYDEAESIRIVVRNDRVRDIVDDPTADPTYKREVTDFHKWEAPKANRERYGDKTTIDVTNTTTITLQNLMDERMKKLDSIIEGTATCVD